MATTAYPIPPAFQIAKVGNQTLQATDAMSAWMRSITTQASAALDKVPVGTVTHDTQTAPTLPENAVVVGNGSSSVSTVPDPATPDLVLVSSTAGQRPRWVHLAAITPTGVQLRMEELPPPQQQGPPPPPLSDEQQQIVRHIVFLLQELVRVTRNEKP